MPKDLPGATKGAGARGVLHITCLFTVTYVLRRSGSMMNEEERVRECHPTRGAEPARRMRNSRSRLTCGRLQPLRRNRVAKGRRVVRCQFRGCRPDGVRVAVGVKKGWGAEGRIGTPRGRERTRFPCASIDHPPQKGAGGSFPGLRCRPLRFTRKIQLKLFSLLCSEPCGFNPRDLSNAVVFAHHAEHKRKKCF